MRYVLVHWSSGSLKTSILTEEYVLDKSMMNDPDKEGMVVFVKPGGEKLPKHKVKAYLGRVKYVSEQREVIEQKQRLFLAETNGTPKNLSPPRNRKRHISELDDHCENTMKKPPIAITDQLENKSYANHCNLVSDFKEHNKKNGEPNWLSRQTLQEKIAKLEEELATEKALVKELTTANLVLQNSLPDLLRNAVESCSVTQQLKTRPTCTCTCLANSLTTRSRKAGKNSSSKEQTSSDPAASSEEQSAFENSEPLKDEDAEARSPRSSQNGSLSALLDPVQMLQISRAINYKKMTTALLSALFERSVLAKSSVTGKSKAGRPALDKKIVELIIAHVQECFPATTVKDIKATMAQKCKDLRKSAERKNTPIKAEDQMP